MSRALVIVGTVLGATSFSHAQISYVSQSRSVNAFSSGPNQSIASTDFGLFDALATSAFPEEGALSTASQTSTLGIDSITATASTSAEALNGFSSSSSTFFSVTFDIAFEAEFFFDGSLFVSQFGDSSLLLSGPSGEVLRLGEIPGSSFVQGLETDGVFEPGRYSLVARGFGRSSSDIGDAGGFNFTLSVVPAPGAGALFACSIFMTRRRRP